MSGLLLLILIIVLIVLRQPVLVLLMAALGYSYLVWGDDPLYLIALDSWDALNKDILLSIPLYLLSGNLMSRGSMAMRITDVMREATAPIPGGLALAALLACGLFAAMSGSSTVTLLAVGSVLYPALRAQNYPVSFSVGLLCAGGTLGIIIPPSIPLILYGVMTRASIVDLFVAGIAPALLLLLLLGIYILWTCRHMPRSQFNREKFSLAARRSVLAMLTPVIILGGIYSGFFTATEAAAVSVIYAWLVQQFIYRDLAWGDTVKVMEDTSRLIGSLFPVLMFAVCLTLLLAMENVPTQLVDSVSSFIDDKMMFLILTNLLLLVVGCLVDIGSAILVLAPLLKPMANSVGIDTIHLGIMMVMNLEIGYLTPPLGLNLIVAMGAFRVDFLQVCRACLPYIGLLLIGLIIVALFPAMVHVFL
jgi:C4-dicarboxylate transporter DctM subunit